MAAQAVQLTRKDLVEPGLLRSVNNVNRSGNAFAAGTYAGVDAFADGLGKAGLDAAAGAYAAAGLGCARAEWSVFDAEAKGPNASVGAGASLSSVSAKAFARAELASASASAGPVKATVGLGLDTGVGIGVTGVEAKVLGTDAGAHAVMRAGRGITANAAGALEMIDTFDRPGTAFTEETFARAGTFADAFEDKPGKRLPKAGAYAEAGVGHARAEWSVFDAEAKGPNASAGAEASVASVSAQAFARAEIASASASAGPVKATVGLGLDTGVGIGVTGVLGTGISFGRKMSISRFGTFFEFNLW